MAGISSDHNVSRPIIHRLQIDGLVIVTARDAGLDRAADDVHLLTAAQRGWTLITCDKDFELLHGAWQRWSAAWGIAVNHAGIVIFPQRWPVERAAQELTTLLRTTPPSANELYEWILGGWRRYPRP